MLDVDAIHDRRPAGAEPGIFVDRGADDDTLRHPRGELVGGVITSTSTDAGEVGAARRREGGEQRQIAGGDELAHARTDRQRVEDVVKPLAVEALWGGGDTQDFRLREGGEDTPPRVSSRMMTLIDDEKIGRHKMFEPPHQGLHARNLYRMLERRQIAAGDDQRMRHSEGIECPRDLLYDFVTVAADADTIAAPDSTSDDLAEDYGFAATARTLITHTPNTAAELCAQPRQIVDLIGTQHRRHGRCCGRQQIGHELDVAHAPPPKWSISFPQAAGRRSQALTDRVTMVMQAPRPLCSSASQATRPAPMSTTPVPGSLPIEPSGRMNFVLPPGKSNNCALGTTTS